MGGDFLGYIYGTVRRLVRTFSGRKRYNVLGALDYVSKKVTSIANDTYITVTEVCEFLKKIAAEYVGKTIFIVFDNARYQRCDAVRELAKRLGIQLVFIPPYSPNLNLIERMWKFVKNGLRAKYYDQFEAFKDRIDTIVDTTHTSNFEIINRLIGRGVQLFDDLVPAAKNSFKKRKNAA